MDRRTFLAATLTAASAAGLPGLAAAAAGTDSSPTEVLVALGTGNTVLLDFYAADCPACDEQGRVIAALRENSPGLADAVSFLSVDFDAHGASELAKVLKVEESGTLIVLKGGKEFGRLVGETDVTEIRALVKTAYEVATD